MDVPDQTASLDFSDLGVRPDILAALEKLGFETPTPIQRRVIALLLGDARDVVALAQTGTGKTAAYGIPLIQSTQVDSPHTQGLVLCPTRELCVQVTGSLRALAQRVGRIAIEPVYGGASIRQQILAVRHGAHIVVATPGRLVDLLERGAVRLERLRTLVLDEADEMLGMGFRDELDTILGKTPATKQTLLFSATTSRDVAQVAAAHMREPVKITVGKENAAADNVHHHYYVVNPRDRHAVVKRLADMYPHLYGIIFCRTRADTQYLADRLFEQGHSAEALNGNLSQAQRDLVMDRFRRRQIQLLVATDVAARGLDVSDLSHVINYELPEDMSVYTHRAGRTGRAGNSGTSVSIIHPRERYRIDALQRHLKVDFEQQEVPSGRQICERQIHHFIDRLDETTAEKTLLDPYLDEIHAKLAGIDRATLIKRFVAAQMADVLSYYKDARDLNVSVDRSDALRLAHSPHNRRRGHPTDVSHGGRGPVRGERQKGFVRLTLNVGRDDGVTPTRLIGRINQALRCRSIAIGRIELGPHATTFEADGRYADNVRGVFAGSRINGKRVFVAAASGPRAAGPGARASKAKQRCRRKMAAAER